MPAPGRSRAQQNKRNKMPQMDVNGVNKINGRYLPALRSPIK